ncbi:hypothetical protein FUA23_14255 [Neolewinella aurantiaca]|uniref:Sulfotransferase family protein n=2 Tax=Neolewinella aurantiaca TaxID=2602767 RepID=A0A5C7FTB1_9BACT|nr:hypothetical protein FUA23_14255 [Neolewinella aurantiaca]
MYSFAQRPDTAVEDEPLYAHYLLRQPTEADHPGREDILQSQNNNGNEVTARMLSHDYQKEVVVFKQMTHHLIDIDTGFLDRMDNVLLIRDPRAILNSFSKVVEKVTARDIGVPQQFALFQRLQKAGKLTAVVDARLLLLNPESVLSQLCDRLGIPFTPQMLSWEPGARPEDGIWAAHWYGNVHKSTGFQPWKEKTYNLSPALASIAEACRPAYEEMLGAALRP